MTRARRGYTLIEALVVITLTTVTLITTTVTMHSLHRAERRVRDDLFAQTTVGRLASQLRWDAHESHSATMEGGIDAAPIRSMKLNLAGGRSIQYAATPDGIDRIVSSKDAVEHRESFRLPMPESYWSIDIDRAHPLLTLHLVHRQQGSMDQPVSTNEQLIQATIGLGVTPSVK